MSGPSTPCSSICLRIAALAMTVWGSIGLQAQLVVQPQNDLGALARAITGNGVQILNPQITCHAEGFGQFEYAGGVLGIERGVLLTSGRLTDAIGPNNNGGTSFEAMTSGNALLNVVTNRTTYDACKLEFDVIPAGDTLEFDFVLGSEEYNEWVGSQYNDVFGFFINGPGITGDPGIGDHHNIALVPGTQQAVTINNVNNGSNQAHYFDNAGGQHIQYDGLTRNLSAMAVVQPCQTYHLQLIVADASDRVFDSGVFIAEVKSNPVTITSHTDSGGPDLVEGCNNGFVRFQRQTATPHPLTLQYYLSGTATNGVDYVAIGNPNPNVPKTIVIPAGGTYVDQPIITLADNLNEGSEFLRFVLGNPNCPEAGALDTLEVNLLDTLFGNVQPIAPVICQGDSVQFHIQGGQSYAWTPATGLSSNTAAHPWASPINTTQYGITLTEGACTRTIYRTVRVSKLALSAVVTPPLCHGGTNGAINLSITNGVAPYAYSWTGPNGFTATTQDLTGLVAGTYTVTVQDAGCTRVQSYNVGQPAAMTVQLHPSILVFGQNISCSGGSDGEVDATITGGTGPYGVSWTGPNGFTSTVPDIQGLSAGTYQLQVTDAHGCSAGQEVTLAAASPLEVTAAVTGQVVCAQDQQGSITATITGGAPPYTRTWNTVPAQSGATASGLSPGNYQVVVQDAYGCTASASAAITGPTSPVSVSLTSRTHVRCHGATTGAATVSAAGGTAPYTYQWNDPASTTSASVTGLAGGIHTVTVYDANGCSRTLQVIIEQPSAALSGSVVAQQHIACFGSATGQATVQGQGGSGPYTYVWNTVPAVNGATITGRPAGTYTATITDVQGCQTTVAVTLTQPTTALSAVVQTHTGPSCHAGQDGTATVQAQGGTGPYTYGWNTTPAQSTAVATGLSAGPRTVVVTDAASCSTSVSVMIGQPAALAITGTVVPALCQGAASGAVDISVSGGTGAYQYAWSSGPAFSAVTQDISGLAAGGYTVVVTDGQGCTATRTFEVGQPGLFTLSAVLSDHQGHAISCPGATDGSIVLTVNGAQPPYHFNWMGPGGFTASTKDISGLVPGTYSVVITDANGCGTGANYVLAAPPQLQVQLTPALHHGHAVSCEGGQDGSIDAQVQGGVGPYGYAWTGPSGFTSSVEDPSGLRVGTYSLQVTDANGCTAVQQVQLQAAPALSVVAGSVTGQSCHGSANGQATVTAAGGTAPYTWTWNTAPAQHAATATGLVAGTYTANVVDANGCSAQGPVMVPGPSAPLSIASTSVVNVLCHQGNTGAITVAASGGTPTYELVWNTMPQQFGATAQGLQAGAHSVTVTDANGCMVSSTFTITQPASPLAAVPLSHGSVTCFGANDGTVSIAVSGGSGDRQVVWNTVPVQTGTTAQGLPAGNWVATVTDANGCASAVQVTMQVSGPSAPLSVQAVPYTYVGGPHVSCPGAADGSVQAQVSGGTAPFTYQWSHPDGSTSSGAQVTGLSTGVHTVRVVDAHGCWTQTSVTLHGPSAVQSGATIQSTLCHGDNTGAIAVTLTGGNAPYGHTWTGPSGFTSGQRDITHLYAGVYFMQVTDANGCASLHAFDVTEPGTFTITAALDHVDCADGADGSVDLSVSGGTQPYQYAWSSTAGAQGSTQDLQSVQAGTYFVVVTDANGCQALSTQVLTEPAPLTLGLSANNYAGGYQVSCPDAMDGSIVTTMGGGVPGLSITWSGPAGFTSAQPDLSGLAAGNYLATVTDANGCQVHSNIALTAPTAMQVVLSQGSFTGGSGTSCAGVDDGSMQVAVLGGTAPVTYAWSGPGGFSAQAWSLDGLAPGSYTATVSDANGCTVVRQGQIVAPAALGLSGVVSQYHGSNVSCANGSDGAIDLSVAGGSAPFQVQWTGPGSFTAQAEDLAGLTAGTYAVRVVDANGCSQDAVFQLVQPAVIQTAATVVTAACQGSATGSVDLTTSGGVAPYTWAWSGPAAFFASTEDLNALYAGVYQVTVQDANGCAHAAPFNVGQPGMFQITAATSQYPGGFQVSCPGATDGWIDVTIVGGTQPYYPYWTGPNGFSATSMDLQAVAAGNYLLTMTDANGCGSSASYSLLAPSTIQLGLVPSVYAGGSNTGCSGSADGSIDLSVSGGLAPYTYAWTGPAGAMGIAQDLTGLEAGTYQVVVTDVLGCTATGAITLQAPGGLALTVTAAVYPNFHNLRCHDSNDGAIDLTIHGGAAPFQVHWTGPDGGTAYTEDIHGLPAGDFQVVVTDANGCSVGTMISLKAPIALEGSLTALQYSGGHQVSCAGASDGALTSVVTGGAVPYTYAWSGPSGFTATTSAITGLSPGAHVLLVTDAMGCTMQLQSVLTAPSPVSVQALLSDAGFGYNVGCTGVDGAIDLSVSGGTPGYQFDWNGPHGFASQATDLAGLVSGGYQVAVTDANGCTVSRSYHLSGPDAFVAVVEAISNECADSDDGRVELTVQGGIAPYTFQWSGPNGFAATSEDVQQLASGTYHVSIMDAGGCTIDTTAIIIAASPIIWDVYASQYGDVNIPCHGGATGVFGLTVQGGFHPIQIDWAGPNGFEHHGTYLTGLLAGTYQLSVTDDHGCVRDTTITLVQPELPLQAVLQAEVQPSGSNISCHAGSDGNIHATVTGGVSPYQFDWRANGEGFSSAASVDGLSAGLYELVVTDSNSCQVTLQIGLTAPADPLEVEVELMDWNGVNVSCTGATDGSLVAAATGGSPSYMLQWTGPDGYVSQADTLTGLAAGTYVLLVTDVNGCTLERSVVVVAPEALAVDLNALLYPSGGPISCAGANDAAFLPTVEGGVAPYDLSWTGPDGFTSTAAELTQLPPGTYCLQVVDANGCELNSCSTVVAPDPLTVDLTASASSCGLANGSVVSEVAGGSQPYTAAWSNGITDIDLHQVGVGTYTVVITDINGCTAAASAPVDGTPAVLVDHGVIAPLCHDGAEGAIDVTVQQGTAPFQFVWSDGVEEEDRTGLAGGSYGLVVTDANGCNWSMDIEVQAPDVLAADSTFSLYPNGHEVSTYGGNDGSITLAPHGGTAPYQVVWSNGASGTAIGSLPAGVYAATITDANGCTLSMEFLLEGPTEIRVPTGFTPNGDGQNDAFVVQGIEGYPENQLTVFNRWGNVVYDRLNYANDWRGENQQGGDLANGTYFVVLRLTRTGVTLQNYVDLRR